MHVAFAPTPICQSLAAAIPAHQSIWAYGKREHGKLRPAGTVIGSQTLFADPQISLTNPEPSTACKRLKPT